MLGQKTMKAFAVALWVVGTTVSVSAQEPQAAHTEASKDAWVDAPWAVGVKLTQQGIWEDNDTVSNALGFGITAERRVFRPLAIEVDMNVLFAENDLLTPLELCLKWRFANESIVEPYVSFGPGVAFEIGGIVEGDVLYGAITAFGAHLWTHSRFGLLIDMTYRLYTGARFEQQMALSIGPIFAF